MWKDEDKDVRAQLLLSVSGSVEPSEYSCDIFMIFQFLAAYDDSALLCTNYTTLVLMFIKNEGVGSLISTHTESCHQSCVALFKFWYQPNTKKYYRYQCFQILKAAFHDL